MSVNINLAGASSSSSSAGSNFAGIVSGINTTALVQAEISQASQPQQAMQNQVTADQNRSSALSTLSSDMTSLASAITTMDQQGFSARTVTSSDSSNSYVTATASGGATGSYDVSVQSTAVAARLTPTLDSSGNPTNLAVQTGSSAVFTGTSASFTLTDTNGNTATITLGNSNNTIYGLADAINAAQAPNTGGSGPEGLGIQATVVNTGAATDPYQLVLTSSSTGVGTGANGTNISIADSTAGGAVNSLGIASTAAGGTQSNQQGKNAAFTLDGIQMSSTSNSVSSAVDGVTFQLLNGGQTGSTTLTVAEDTTTATNDMQGVVSAYNKMMQDYTGAAAYGGALYGDSSAQGLVNQVATALNSIPSGMATSTTLNSAASLGLSTNEDGTLSLDTTAFQDAITSNAAAAQNVFSTYGSSTNPVLSMAVMGPNTATGNLAFVVNQYTPGGAVQATITTPDGTQYTLNGNNGVLVGGSGTELAGLYLSVTGTGSGTLSLSRGVGQAALDTINSLTAYGTGQIATLQNSINDDISNLNVQIASQQNMLNTMQTNLENQYSQMEATLAQLQAAGSSLSSLS